MKTPIIFFLLFYSFDCIGEAIIPVRFIVHADTTPVAIQENISYLTDYLVEFCETDSEKVLIISYWIARNIRAKWSREIKNKGNKDAEKVLIDKTAVCGGFANLFKGMCDEIGVRCFYISGYARGGFFENRFGKDGMGHAWNVIYMNDRWHLMDLTWCCKEAQSNEFREKRLLPNIFVPPGSFAERHYPNDPRWQMLTDFYSRKEFFYGKKASEKGYAYQDSLRIMVDRDEVKSKICSIKARFGEDKDRWYYFADLIKLGRSQIRNEYDSVKIYKGLEIFEFINLELERLGIFPGRRHFVRAAKKGIAAAKYRGFVKK